MKNTEHRAHEQHAATAVADWLRRHYADTDDREPEHDHDPFVDGYLHALDIAEQAIDNALRATEAFPGCKIEIHDQVHEGDESRSREHTEPVSATPEPQQQAEHQPHDYRYWLVSLVDTQGSEYLAESIEPGKWLLPGVSTETWDSDEIRLITPLMRADRMTVESDYRLAPWEDVDGKYIPQRWSRYVTDWMRAR